jgi:formamidase
MPKVAFHADLKATPEAAEIKTHNRWHPDLPMVETFKPGAEFRVECFDWTGGQIAPDDSANDVRDVDLTGISKIPANLASRSVLHQLQHWRWV